jgi:filamentous hemagglutinin family protein
LGSESSTVIPNATVQETLVDLITGGAIRENNLFHSFSELNIREGEQLYFANPDGIANILTRVTGNNVSEIFGTLGVDGTANLFLLNPNGIVFGENAALDVNGSFLATTADSYIFNNSFAYSANHPNSPPLLTINIPVGLQFGSNPGTISVLGTGHNLNLGFDPSTTTVFRNFRATGLKINSGNTLALVGGEIAVDGGNLTAEAGRIELGSVSEESNVSLILTDDGFTLDYQNTDNFQDINLTQSASIDVSGNGGGNLQLQGKNIDILDSSAIVNNNNGTKNGGYTNIIASDSLQIIGTDEGLFPSAIFSQVDIGTRGNGSRLTINTQTLEIANNAFISSTIAGSGNGGDIEIKTETATFTGASQLSFYTTGISSYVLFGDLNNPGNSGNIDLQVGSLQINNGASITSATFGAGDSGDLSIKADSIALTGTSPLSLIIFLNEASSIPSSIFTTASLPSFLGTSGNAGDIDIETNSLSITNGGQIRAGTFGLGNSGNISIKAETIAITDTLFVEGNSFFSGPIASGIFASSGLGKLTRIFTQTTGNGGNIDIETESLKLANGGQIGTGTSSNGKSGNLSVKAQEISIVGQLFDNDELALTGFANTSGLFSSVVRSDARGAGGDILVETNNLNIQDGGAIAANVFGKGNGGNITINADNLNVSNSFLVSDVRSGLTTTVEATGSGKAGRIDIIADNANIVDGGSISANAIGRGDAGDINLQVVNLTIDGTSPEAELESQIAAFSQGNVRAGSIDLYTNSLDLSDRGLISVSNLGNGDSGNLNITTPELNLDNFATIEAEVNAGNQGNINLTTDNLFLRNNSQITAKATGTATGGNITINNTDNIVLLENSQILANAVQGNGGNINITTQGYFVSPDSKISASSEFGLDGDVEINIAEDRTQKTLEEINYNFISIEESIDNRCFGSQFSTNSSFTYVGRGELPIDPETRIDEGYDLDRLNIVNSSINNQIIEANTIAVNNRGKIVLFDRSTLADFNSKEFPYSNFCQLKIKEN